MPLHSYHLKYIALFTMILDHIGYIFSDRISPNAYLLLRSIGRMAFPLYCFLLVEGFFHTRDRNRYLTRLLLFCALSEIPFDLAFSGSVVDLSHQNVFFTLAFGFAAMLFCERTGNSRATQMLGIISFLLLADFLKFDYGAFGILTILLFYLRKKQPSIPLWACLLPLMCLSKLQAICIFSVIFLYLYHGEKGRGAKYLFYVAYPAHLLLLYFIHVLW